MKKYFIHEMSAVPVSLQEGKEQYVFEGLFADFNKNRNGRVYDVKNYMECVESLKGAIESKSLLGEMDHPDRFEISMQEVSHMITDIELVEEEGQQVVKGKIKLIETSRGKDAIAIAESGAPLYISSRGAGSVDKNGKVTLDEIFTYDIVSQPGFEKARMNRIEEMREKNPELVGLMESRNIFFTPIDESTDTPNDHKSSSDINKPKRHDNQMDNITAKVQHLEGRMATIQESIAKTGDINKIVEGLVEFMDTFTQNYNTFVEGVSSTIQAIQEDNTKVKQYLDTVREVVNHNAGEEGSAKNEDFAKLVQYAEAIAEAVNRTDGKIKRIVEHNKKATLHRNTIVEHVNHLTDYSEVIAEHANALTDHNDTIVEHVNKLTSFSDAIAEHANKLADHNDLIVTHINENGIAGNGKTEKTGMTNENIAKKTAALINEAKARIVKTDSVKLNEAFNDRQSKIFEKFTDKQKSDFTSKYGTKIGGMNKVEITKALLNEQKGERQLADFLKFAPAKYRSIWEKLDAKTKGVISSMASKRNIINEAQCKLFWESLNLSNAAPVNDDLLLESKKMIASSNVNVPQSGQNLGYSNAVITQYLKQ